MKWLVIGLLQWQIEYRFANSQIFVIRESNFLCGETGKRERGVFNGKPKSKNQRRKKTHKMMMMSLTLSQYAGKQYYRQLVVAYYHHYNTGFARERMFDCCGRRLLSMMIFNDCSRIWSGYGTAAERFLMAGMWNVSQVSSSSKRVKPKHNDLDGITIKRQCCGSYECSGPEGI